MNTETGTKISPVKTKRKQSLPKEERIIRREATAEDLPDLQPLLKHDDESFSRRVVLITGGLHGIGRAVAETFIREGADVAITYRGEYEQAKEIESISAGMGEKTLLIAADIGKPSHCKRAIEKAIARFGGIDVLIHCDYLQQPVSLIQNILPNQLEQTFRINIFSLFYMVQAALPVMRKNGCIINTASASAFTGNPSLLDYTASQGAVIAFTKSLALMLSAKGIRVNAIAPGILYTQEELASIASCYLFLSTKEALSINGETIPANGGIFLNHSKEL